MESGLSDKEIIARVLNAEPQAFAGLVERYQNYVFTLVLRLVEKREDAEELAQDVFVKAYRSLADFRGDSKFSTWLYTIVRTTCLTFLRKKKLFTTSLDIEKNFVQASNHQSSFYANGAEQKSRQALVNEAIKMLGPDDAHLIALFYSADQSLEEIGTVLGIEANTVKVKLYRARQKLREKIEKHFGQEAQELYSL
jgi:RNA polymerase sigma factor (sigma-70 family)